MSKGFETKWALLLLLIALIRGQSVVFWSDDGSNMDDWTKGDGNIRVATSNCPTSSSCFLVAGDQFASGEIFAQRTVSTVGYKSIKIHYDMVGNAVYCCKSCYIYWSKGSGWNLVDSMGQVEAAVIGGSKSLTTYADSISIKLKNSATNGVSNAYLYQCLFDNIKLSGIPYTDSPTKNPSQTPTKLPTTAPTTSEPTTSPSAYPTKLPTLAPTPQPSDAPSLPPSAYPTKNPSVSWTNMPSQSPSNDYNFEECVKDFALSDDESISIDMDSTNKKMRITLYITSGAWFGIGFGRKTMKETYGIIVASPDGADIEISSRIFGDHTGGDLIDDFHFESIQKAEVMAARVVSMVRDWDISGSDSMYSFTEFFECSANTRILPIIWAKGYDENFGYHGQQNRQSDLELVSCTCATTESPTGAPTHDTNVIISTAYRVCCTVYSFFIVLIWFIFY